MDTLVLTPGDRYTWRVHLSSSESDEIFTYIGPDDGEFVFRRSPIPTYQCCGYVSFTRSGVQNLKPKS